MKWVRAWKKKKGSEKSSERASERASGAAAADRRLRCSAEGKNKTRARLLMLFWGAHPSCQFLPRSEAGDETSSPCPDLS